MAKLTTADVLRIATPILKAQRRVRDMVERLLIEQRMIEDAAKVKSGETVE